MAKKRNAADSALRRKSRLEILELLIRAMEENEQLKEENSRLKQKLETQTITYQETGTLAEACLKLSGIFEAADRAIALYQQQTMETGFLLPGLQKEIDDGDE